MKQIKSGFKRKIVRIIAMICFVQLFFPGESNAQAITIHQTDKPVREVLRVIEATSNMVFFYNNNDIDLDRKVSIQVSNGSIEKVLDLLFAGTQNTYKIDGRQVYIMKKTGKEGSPQQQKKTIIGKITDEQGEPVIGVNIIEQGTTNGTVTDVDGNFSLIVSDKAILRVSYIGYVTQVIPTAGKTTIDIVLQEDTGALEEVVVVGYGIQKKVNLTGAITGVKSSDIANRTASNATNLLAGIAPGLTAIQRSGQPGADGSEFIIRGIGSLNSVSPLIIVDGIPGDMGILDANDIESISILKDAASAAIYGVRAANGVILVTTKKGKEGKMNLSYNGYAGFQNPTRLPKWVNSAEYATLYNEALENDGLAPKYTAEDIENFRQSRNPDIYPNSDQTKELLSRSGFQHSHHIQLDGGAPKIRYNLSLGYLDRAGLIAQTEFKRYTLRGNFDFDISDRINFGLNFSYIHQKKQQPYLSIGGLVQRSYRETPVTPIQWSDGTWVAFMNEHNSVAQAEDGGYDRYTDHIFTSIGTLDIRILDGLSAKGIIAVNTDFMHTKMQEYNLTLYNKGGVVGKKTRPFLYESRGESLDINAQALLNYNKIIGRHDISSVLGYEQRQYSNSYIGASRYDLPGNNLLDQINAGDASTATNDGTLSDHRIRSAFGRINYVFDRRYLLEFTLRYDGSSRFPKENRFEYFPAFSAGWRISEEHFFNVEQITNLKLRGSWGKLGNQEIGNYTYQNKYAIGRLYGFGNVLYSGIAESYNLANETIGWEKTEMINAGVDLDMFRNKLSLTFDYFIRNTDAILMSLPQPTLLGAYAPTINAGAVENKGFELQLGWQERIRDFEYGAKLSLSKVRDKITDLKGADAPGRRVGDPVNNIFGLEVIGIFQSQDEINNSPNQDYTGGASPGDLKYKDQNDDNRITAEDRVNLGNTFPSVTVGLQLSGAYKGFDLSATLHAVADVEGYLTGEAAQAFFNGGSALKYHRDRWTPDNPNASYPRLTLNSASRNHGQVNSFFMEDASYLKMRNLQIGYRIPPSITKRLNVEKCRVYLNADNLFTLTNFRGFDPETPWGSGNIYPMVTTYSFGLNLVF